MMTEIMHVVSLISLINFFQKKRVLENSRKKEKT